MAPSKQKKRKKKKKTKAEKADRHELYQIAVQDPEFDEEVITQFFKTYRKRKPLSIKEDFCGTALFATHWAKSSKKRWAVGVDLDGPTLAWGIEHNLEPEDESVRDRVVLHEANVLDVVEPKVDVVCALNYSYSVFKKREELRDYFQRAHDSLVDDGIFVLDLFGGTEAIEEHDDPPRKCDGFMYHWEHAYFNPIDHHTICHIHFSFSDRSRINKAFEYDWRLWTIPEIRELLEAVGFSDSRVWWDDGDEDTEYFETEEVDNQAGWLAYIVGIK